MPDIEHIRYRPLNVWWFSQYASTPDQQFTGQFDLAKRLVDGGHRITFFSAGFSHYKFREIRLRSGEHTRVDDCQGVRFVWVRTPSYAKNDWRRALNICSYAWRAYRLAQRLDELPDVIIGTTFHPMASLVACLLASSRKRPFVFEVKDLWPLTVVEFGRLAPKSPVTRALSALERFLAKKASRILTTLPKASEYFARLGVPSERVVWIPNGLELSRYENLEPYSGKLHGRCTLLYAGGHVSANALETILLAAKLEMEQRSNVHFLFVGGGQDKPRLMALARDWNLQNVEFRDAVPKSELSLLIQQADALLLSMRNLPGLYRYGMSFNKLCDYTASGRPILFAGAPSHNLVELYNCGIVVPPEDPAALSLAIHRFLVLSTEVRAAMGRNAIRCARENFDMEFLGRRLEEMLLSVANETMSSRDSRRAPGKASSLEARTPGMSLQSEKN